MTETWRPVPHYEGVYEVSDKGRVASLPRARRRTRRILRPSLDPRGYPGVRLSSMGVAVARRVHVLVAAAFIGERPERAVIRHLDGNQSNNSVENLTYGTQSENIADAVRHGHHNHADKTHCTAGHPLDVENTFIRRYDSARVCRECKRARNRESYARVGKPSRRHG